MWAPLAEKVVRWLDPAVERLTESEGVGGAETTDEETFEGDALLRGR